MSGEPVEGVEPFGPAVYHVVYYRDMGTSAWWVGPLDPEFVHVEVWWTLGDDYWIAFQPNHSYLASVVIQGAPTPGSYGITAVQRVECLRSRLTPMCPIGVKTCVSLVKAVLGIRAAWLLTPRQLFDYINKRPVLQ